MEEASFKGERQALLLLNEARRIEGPFAVYLPPVGWGRPSILAVPVVDIPGIRATRLQRLSFVAEYCRALRERRDNRVSGQLISRRGARLLPNV